MSALVHAKTPPTLVKLDEARAMIAECKSVDDLKQMRDKAEALKAYLRQQAATRELQNDAAEIKVRAERRIGQLLIETKKNGQRANQGSHKKLHDATSSTPTIAELGIEKTAAKRWQDLARAPEKVFEEYIADARNDEITSSGARRAAIAALKEPVPEEPFHPLNAIGDLKNCVRKQIADWPKDARGVIPTILRDLAEEVESENANDG